MNEARSPHQASPSKPGGSTCPVCHADGARMIYPDTLGNDYPRLDYGFCADHGRTYEIRACDQCSHRFAVVNVEDLWKTYRDLVDPAYLERAEERAATFRKLVDRIQKHVAGGRLLDIGCATGDFLQIASRCYEVEGVELSRWSSAIARARGFSVHSSRLSEIEGDGSYDVITLWGVIGLFEHPHTEVAEMARLLRPGGVVCILSLIHI